MPELVLVCEGPSDLLMLRPLFAQVLTSAGITVEHAGGGRGLGAVADYIARQRNARVAYVCDRDYRRENEVESAFADGKRCFYWRRHSAENYLLQPRVVVAGFDSLRRRLGASSRLAAALPRDLSEVEKVLRECAIALAPVEAGCLAVTRLWEDLSDTAGRFQKRLPKLPVGSSPGACMQFVLAEASRLRQKAEAAAASDHLKPQALQDRYDAVLADVVSAPYLDSFRFLEEFNGKSLRDQLLARLHARGLSQLSTNSLTTMLAEAIPKVYAADRAVFSTDDFLDLTNGVRALAGLPPLP